VASLAPHPGEVTYGSVAELTYKEKEALDEYEGGYVIAHTWSHDPTCRLNPTSIELTMKTLLSVAGYTTLLSWPLVLVDANYTAHIVARTIAPSGTERRC
jgi:hypothetical protein